MSNARVFSLVCDEEIMFLCVRPLPPASNTAVLNKNLITNYIIWYLLVYASINSFLTVPDPCSDQLILISKLLELCDTIAKKKKNLKDDQQDECPN